MLTASGLEVVAMADKAMQLAAAILMTVLTMFMFIDL